MDFLILCLVLLPLTLAQTFTDCNPLEGECDPDPALGRDIMIDFVEDGPSLSLTSTGCGPVIYDSAEGALFTVSAPLHNPTLQSKFYIMFGKVSVVARVSPGCGIVSSIVLQSDDLDEIDFEFIGSDPFQVQTNYFSKGDTSTYDRGRYHQVDDDITEDFHVYTVEWASSVTKWYVDDVLVRSLYSEDQPDIYPQTPMSIRVGSWAAGDPSNRDGTIAWAGGLINYAEGPFVYAIKSIFVEDYSTGTNYEYTDTSGSLSSIVAHDGEIGTDGPVSKRWFEQVAKLAKPL